MMRYRMKACRCSVGGRESRTKASFLSRLDQVREAEKVVEYNRLAKG